MNKKEYRVKLYLTDKFEMTELFLAGNVLEADCFGAGRRDEAADPWS
jgi:hypothetical protein